MAPPFSPHLMAGIGGGVPQATPSGMYGNKENAIPPASQVTSEHVTFAPTPGAGDVKTGQQESVQQVRPPPHQSRISPEGYRRCGMNKSHLCRVPPSPAPDVPRIDAHLAV